MRKYNSNNFQKIMGFETTASPEGEKIYKINTEELEGVKPEDLYGEAVASVENVEKWGRISTKAKELLAKEFDQQEMSDLFANPEFKQKSMREWKDQSEEDLANGLAIRAKEEILKKRTIN